MAIVKMNRLHLTFDSSNLDRVLYIMQGFQGVHIDDEFHNTIPILQKTEIEKEISEIERTLQDIHAACSVLEGRKSVNLLSSLTQSEERRLTLSELAELVEQSEWREVLRKVLQTDRRLRDNRKRRQELSASGENLYRWECLNTNPLDFKKMKLSSAFFGSVHEIHAEDFVQELMKYAADGIYFEKVINREDRVFYLVTCHNSIKSKVTQSMGKFSYSVEHYRFEKPQVEMRGALEKEEKALIREEKEIDQLLESQSQYEEILRLAEDYHLNLLLRKRKSLDLHCEENIVEINGWIIAERREKFNSLLKNNLPKDTYSSSFSDVTDMDIDSVPIMLKNGKIATAFESLTRMYSLPKYYEVDPTPVMTVFYMLFFGMMVADIGYGFAIFLIGFIIRKFLKVKRGTKSFVGFLYYLSFPIMGWGFVFGSFCGFELPFRLWSVTVDIIPMTILSIILGYIHIMTGLVLYMINRRKRGKNFDLVTGGLSWFLSFLGGGLMILSRMVPLFRSNTAFFIGCVILSAGLFMIVVVPAIEYKRRWYAGLGKGLYALYGAMSYLGDFISYTRLMALGVAGGSVALAFNSILGFMPPVARFSLGILLGIVLHTLNIGLTMLSAYVHGIRLQFIEFFGKFYTGGGEIFKPFKAAEKNVVITDIADDKLVEQMITGSE